MTAKTSSFPAAAETVDTADLLPSPSSAAVKGAVCVATPMGSPAVAAVATEKMSRFSAAAKDAAVATEKLLIFSAAAENTAVDVGSSSPVRETRFDKAPIFSAIQVGHRIARNLLFF